MKTTSILIGLAAASSVIAAPGTAARREKNEKRLAASRKSNPFRPADVSVNGPENANVQYSTNWAGAALSSSGFTGVTGTFTVPTVKAPAGASSTTSYSSSAWVGIDGYKCSSAILQTGLDFTVRNGKTTYSAWYEWFPNYAVDFTGITFSAGDSVTVSVTATSKTSGTATIKNNTTGKSVSHTFTGQTAGSLCETDAEWIVEDFESNGALVPVSNFGTVTFTNAYATKGGAQVGVTGANILDMSTSGSASGVEAQSSLSGTNGVVVKYV